MQWPSSSVLCKLARSYLLLGIVNVMLKLEIGLLVVARPSPSSPCESSTTSSSWSEQRHRQQIRVDISSVSLQLNVDDGFSPEEHNTARYGASPPGLEIRLAWPSSWTGEESRLG